MTSCRQRTARVTTAVQMDSFEDQTRGSFINGAMGKIAAAQRKCRHVILRVINAGLGATLPHKVAAFQLVEHRTLRCLKALVK